MKQLFHQLGLTIAFAIATLKTIVFYFIFKSDIITSTTIKEVTGMMALILSVWLVSFFLWLWIIKILTNTKL